MRGNPIVKIAVIVLFFGVAFLFKYAADNNLFPIEWRLLSISAAAIALLLWGLKIRGKEKLYSLVIQGGALGILYLTVFAAAKFYSVLPLSAALVMMVLLVAFSGFLAIWQDSKSLAVFAAIGGFLAPVLTATNTGNHVQLFSYYAVLNLGILGVSWFKAWRLLIWLGFVFTFGIGAAWGFFDYRDELFDTTEPFLLFFFALYLCIPILYLRKQSSDAKGVLDSSVVFGLPTISFMMQYYLVEGHFAHGDAWSALGWGLAYLVSYTAIAAVFLTVTVFFAFSKDVTAVFWALEGVGLMWLGCRQKQFLPRAAGIALQVLAAAIFADHYGKITGSTILINTQHLVLVCISIAVLANSYLLHRNQQRVLPVESWLGKVLLVVGLFIWYLGGMLDMIWYQSQSESVLSILIFFSASSLLCLFAGRQLGWPGLATSSQFILFAGALILAGNYADNSYAQPLVGLGWVAYPLMLASMALVLRFLEVKANQLWSEVLHAVAVLSTVFLAGWVISTGVSDLASDRDWYPIMWGLTGTVALAVLYQVRYSRGWPIQPFSRIYTLALPAILSAATGVWILASSWQLIQPHDWNYIPLLNPLELVHVAGFWILSRWALDTSALERAERKLIKVALPFLLFIWINTLVAKSVHYWAGIRFDTQALLAYPMFQAATSVLWSILALIFVTLSRKKLSRNLWLTGITLLALVVLKLLLFDMVDSGTLGRIISFLAVGVLMLVIGYIAPMPPKPGAPLAE
jgi:uncharacterized membrane protein